MRAKGWYWLAMAAALGLIPGSFTWAAFAESTADWGERRVPHGSRLGAGPASSADSGTSASRRLTLAEALAEARRAGPDAAVWRAAWAGARDSVADATRRFHHDPTVALVSRPPRFLQNQNEHLWDMSISMPLGPLSAVAPRRETASRQAEQQALEMTDRLAALDEAVARAVADLAYAQRALARAERLVALAGQSVRGGEQAVDPAELLEQDAARRTWWRAKVRYLDARAERDRARLRLARLLGRASPEGLEVEDTFVPPPPPVRPDFQRLVEQDPRVLAREAAAARARAVARLQDRLARPAPVLGVSYGRGPWGFLVNDLGIPSDSAGPSKPQIAFTLMVALPLFERNRAARVQAAARAAVAEAEVAVARADVLADLKARWMERVRAYEVLQALKHIPETLQQDLAALETLERQGRLTAQARARWLQDLEASAEAFDEAVRRWRYAEAQWRRVRALSLTSQGDPANYSHSGQVRPGAG